MTNKHVYIIISVEMKQVSCTLQSLYDETVVISLPHNVPVVLGRIEEQKIADIGCSRRQCTF